jgi:hypothetical protein
MYEGSIGERAYSESVRLFGDVKTAVKEIGVSHRSVMYRWRDHGHPQAYFLSKLYTAGADIGYILTGKREK